MIRSCPDRLEFKNECYSTVNQSISKKSVLPSLLTYTWRCENITASPCGNNWVPRITEIPKFYRNPRIFTEIPLDITEIPIRSSEIPLRWKDITLF